MVYMRVVGMKVLIAFIGLAPEVVSGWLVGVGEVW